MSKHGKSGCPVNLGLELFGDPWTLLIVRDLMFGGKRHFREFLESEEHISSNILTDRLRLLITEGIVTRSGDPAHTQRMLYHLTEKGIALLPILTQISEWSFKYAPVAEQYHPASVPGQDEAATAKAMMAALREQHLGSETRAITTGRH